jgi:flavin reductase (DIM6/NTAB) family NADH-FMN oxidoreductase RutF
MVDFEPRLIACVVSEVDYSFAALRKTCECVIAITAIELAPKVVKVGNTTGRDIDKFAAFGLTAVPAKRVGAPLVAECFANLECEVIDTGFVNRYNLFVSEVVEAWMNPKQKKLMAIHHQGYGTFVVDGETIKLKSKLPSRAAWIAGRPGNDQQSGLAQFADFEGQAAFRAERYGGVDLRRLRPDIVRRESSQQLHQRQRILDL